MWNTTPRGNIFTTGGPTVPSGEPNSQDKSKLRPSARVFEEMRDRETTAQRVRRTHRGREHLKGRLAGGGWRLEACWGGGTSLRASERVAFFRIGVPGKAAQIPEESRESKVSTGNSTRSQVLAPNVRKNAAFKESSRENSCP
jgi:hypothetical protein